MKLIISVDAIHKPLTGIGRYALELSRELSLLLPDETIKFFTFGRWVELKDLLSIDNPNHTYHSNDAAIEYLRKLLSKYRPAVNLYKHSSSIYYKYKLKNFKDHVFHSPNYFLPRHPGPKVVTIHDLSHIWLPHCHPTARVNYLNSELSKTTKHADLIICPSESVRKELIGFFDLPSDRVVSIPMGVNTIYQPRTSTETEYYLSKWGLKHKRYSLYVGTIEPRKNLKMLLSVYSTLPIDLRKAYPLVIAGSWGWDSEDIRKQLCIAVTQGWLFYLDYVPQISLPSLYAGAKLFVYPSIYEGFGLPPLEAMSSGVPVVCSDSSSLPEVVGDAAFKFPSHDHEALRNCLLTTLEDPILEQNAIKKGLERSRLFTWKRCMLSTIEVYNMASNI